MRLQNNNYLHFNEEQEVGVGVDLKGFKKSGQKEPFIALGKRFTVLGPNIKGFNKSYTVGVIDFNNTMDVLFKNVKTKTLNRK